MFMLFFLLLCNGACYAEALISIYRVSWTIVADGECPLVLCHVSWDPPTYTWILGKTDILQNVAVFLRILQNVVVFIMIFIWVHVNGRSDMYLSCCRWISHEFLGCIMKIVLGRTSECSWIRSSLKSVLELVQNW